MKVDAMKEMNGVYTLKENNRLYIQIEVWGRLSI